MQTEIFENSKLSGATFSENRKYRYALWRIWDESKPLVMFIGLNPSKANESEPDSTITKVKKIAEHNGFGGFYMMNCFAFVSTDPDLLEINEVSTTWNNDMITVIASRCRDVVFAWGDFKEATERADKVKKLFPNALALHINKTGNPKHPLYCLDEQKLIPFR